MITEIYWANRFGEEVLKYARVRDPVSEEEYLLEAHQLHDPEDAEVGDENAYKVSLLQNPKIFEYDIY